MTLSGLYPGSGPGPFPDPCRAFDPIPGYDLPGQRIDPRYGPRNGAPLHPCAGPEYDPGPAAGPGRVETLYPARNEAAGTAGALADDGLA
jgi:hypothetical protein